MAKQTKNSVKAKGKAGITSGKVMLFVGTGIAGGLLFFAAKHLLKKNADDSSEDGSTPEIKTASLSPDKAITSGRNDNFPLQNGSLGNRVRQLQQALSNIMGSMELSKYTKIDGDFRNGTESALDAAGYPIVLDQNTFEKLLADSSGKASIANLIYTGARSANINTVLSALRQIKTVSDYSAVSTFYKKKGSQSRTIVNDLLGYAFKDSPSNKEKLKSEFTRIGLVYHADQDKWGLSGFHDKELCTIKDSYILDKFGNRVIVKKNTVLGREINSSNGMSYFKTKHNSIHAVPSQDVKYR